MTSRTEMRAALALAQMAQAPASFDDRFGNLPPARTLGDILSGNGTVGTDTPAPPPPSSVDQGPYSTRVPKDPTPAQTIEERFPNPWEEMPTHEYQPPVYEPPPDNPLLTPDQQQRVTQRRGMVQRGQPEQTPYFEPPPPPPPPPPSDIFDPGIGHLGSHLSGFDSATNPFGNPGTFNTGQYAGGNVGGNNFNPNFVPGYGMVGSGDMSMGGGWGSNSAADDDRNPARRRAARGGLYFP